MTFKLHPSIHFLYLLNQLVGSRGGLSQQSLGERQGTPWTDRQSITGPHRDERDKQPHTCSYSLLGTILETPINLTCMFLDGGRKPEYPEITHAYTGRTWTQKGPSMFLRSWTWNPLAVRRRWFKLQFFQIQSANNATVLFPDQYHQAFPCVVTRSVYVYVLL